MNAIIVKFGNGMNAKCVNEDARAGDMMREVLLLYVWGQREQVQ
ncbi:hypothetical protein WJ542_25485 [Paraburkholderia sp. B3]